MTSIKKIAAVLTMVLVPNYGWPLTLGEFYKIDPVNRVWYLGGIYDANIVEWNKEGQRSKCIEALGLSGFTKKMSEFVVGLPEDPNAKERRAYDPMNVALLAALVIDKECKK
jgi:hypothetical protein